MLKFTRNYFRLLAEGHVKDTKASILAPLLELASWIYGMVMVTTRALYDSRVLPRRRLPFPVISVGNLTWGGSGKTPLVEYLARRISYHNRTPLVLTRGYSRDEVEQFKNHLPKAIVGVGKNRLQVAEEMKNQHRIDLAILDDGLQHWPVERDMEIIVMNALNPFGNGKLIPRGILREPISILSKAGIVLISHVNLIKPEELERGLQEQKKTKDFICTILVRLGLVTQEKVFSVLSRQLNIPYVNLKDRRVDPSVIQRVPAKFASHYKVLPLDFSASYKEVQGQVADRG